MSKILRDRRVVVMLEIETREPLALLRSKAYWSKMLRYAFYVAQVQSNVIRNKNAKARRR